MVPTMATTATSTDSPREPKRARTNSEVLTKPCTWATDHSLGNAT
jgi:hypothetical protein